MTDTRPPGPRTWSCTYGIKTAEVHVRPRHDHIWHPATDDCPCGPTTAPLQDAPVQWVVVHHALDGRPIPTGPFTPEPGPTGDGPAAGDETAA